MVDLAARLTMLTRVGFAARGVLYIVIAILVLTTGRTEDPAGALQYLGQGGGQVLLLVMTLGFLAYGLWRLSDAIVDIERHGNDSAGLRARLGAAGSGVVHLLLAWQAIKLIQGTAAASGNAPDDAARGVLQLPGGDMLLIAGGLLLLGIGAFQIVKAVKGSFLKRLKPVVAAQPWAQWTGRLGYAARGLIFLITGVFLARAGLDEQAKKAGGMAEALSWLTSPWDLVVAAGLFAFGLFSLIEARFRILQDVPVGSIGNRVSSKLF